MPPGDLLGSIVDVETKRWANGGTVIAHVDGRTAFVRGALPGEHVRIRITEARAKFLRAETVEVLRASAHRVEPPCPWAAAGTCGGCDLQHVDVAEQRAMKSEIVAQALRRVWEAPIPVHALPGGPLHWRTSVRWSIDADGHPGLLAPRSHRVTRIARCLLASPGIDVADLPAQRMPGHRTVLTREGSDGDVSITVDPGTTDAMQVAGPGRVTRTVHHRAWRISAGTFWQVHREAATALVDTVLAHAMPAEGEHWWDLYAGAGLFSAFLGEAVGPAGRIDAVEESASAVADARRALHDLPQVRLHERSVDAWVRDPNAGRPHGVVLDPPRAGAGRAVTDAMIAARPARIVTVACDPMPLARDLATLVDAGYRVQAVEAFDLFPMTHHVETIAVLSDDQIS